MTELDLYIGEYGVFPPDFEQFGDIDTYVYFYDTWLSGFSSYMFAKYPDAAELIVKEAALQEGQAIQRAREEEADRIAAEEEAKISEEEAETVSDQIVDEDVAHQEQEQEREEQTAAAQPEVEQGTSDRYPVGSYIDEAGRVWSPAGELLSSEDAAYPSGIYVDPAGNYWSEDGELLSPGTTPAMEPGVNELTGEVVGEPVTGDPTIDTALLLLDLMDALTGEDGMTEDVDGMQRVLDHPLMTTSFQDYTVTEGLLLLLLLSMFVAACAKMLKGGFSWLR